MLTKHQYDELVREIVLMWSTKPIAEPGNLEGAADMARDALWVIQRQYEIVLPQPDK